MPKLIFKFESAVIKEIPITKSPITIGRKPDNDIPIDNPAVSGHHCKIFLSGDIYIVEDLNSTNGTLVNGKKIMTAGIKHNDVIGIVKHSLVYIDEKMAGTSPTPAPEPQSVGGAQAQTAVLQVTDGIVDKIEYEITALSTYIGKSDRANIPIKGSGLFGSAPEVAAMIAKRPEGYFLVAMKENFTKLNGLEMALNAKQALRDGDDIEMGPTKFKFTIKK